MLLLVSYAWQSTAPWLAIFFANVFWPASDWSTEMSAFAWPMKIGAYIYAAPFVLSVFYMLFGPDQVPFMWIDNVLVVLIWVLVSNTTVGLFFYTLGMAIYIDWFPRSNQMTFTTIAYLLQGLMVVRLT